MAARPFIAARIPEDLNLRLEEHSKETGETKTQALVNALAEYLGAPSKQEEPDALKDLEQRVIALEDFMREARVDLELFKARRTKRENSKAPNQLSIVEGLESSDENKKLERVIEIPLDAQKLESKDLLKILREENDKENWKEKLASYRSTKARVGFWHKAGNIKFTYAESKEGDSLHKTHYWWVVHTELTHP